MHIFVHYMIIRIVIVVVVVQSRLKFLKLKYTEFKKKKFGNHDL